MSSCDWGFRFDTMIQSGASRCMTTGSSLNLQACGIINDHGKDCPCYQHIIDNYPTVRKRRYLEK